MKMFVGEQLVKLFVCSTLSKKIFFNYFLETLNYLFTESYDLKLISLLFEKQNLCTLQIYTHFILPSPYYLSTDVKITWTFNTFDNKNNIVLQVDLSY